MSQNTQKWPVIANWLATLASAEYRARSAFFVEWAFALPAAVLPETFPWETMPLLEGLKVAILVADAFEQSEFVVPKRALEQAGAQIVVVSPHGGEGQGFKHFDKGDRFHVDRVVDKARPEDFAALVLPGGVANPDCGFVKEFFDHGKPVGVICNGPWTLIDADVVRGRTITGLFRLCPRHPQWQLLLRADGGRT